MILSLSYSVPVITPDMGDLHYVVQDQVNGFKYQNRQELLEKINQFINLPAAELAEFKRRALESAKQVSYNEIARQTINAYKL